MKAVAVQSGPPKRDASGFPVVDHPGLVTTFQMRSNGGVARQTAKYQSVSTLLDMLSSQLHAPVEDKTGLKDHYDYTLQYAMDMPGINILAPSDAPSRTSDPSEAGPDLTTAIREQLGLKLVPKKATIETLVIDKGNKVPLEN